MAGSRRGRPLPERVGSFAADCSPYAIFDMAGLVSEYCDSAFDADESLRVVKGGNFQSTGELVCRLTHRRSCPRDVPNLHQGFRIIRDLPAGEVDKGARRMVRPRFE
jgi:formylglycine-generating enzyme required for sulfatase activity